MNTTSSTAVSTPVADAPQIPFGLKVGIFLAVIVILTLSVAALAPQSLEEIAAAASTTEYAAVVP